MADPDPNDPNQRPQYQHGVGTIGSTQFHWGSGMPGQYWSIPYGDYPVTPNAPTGAWAHQAGAIPIANNVIPDPLLGRNRVGIMIHSGSASSLDQLYTEGCFKVDPQDWPNVRSQILAQADKGPLYLHVAPGGVAAFTNTKTFSQAGDATPAAAANTVANTTANQPSSAAGAPKGAPAGGGSFLDSLAQVESNNRNIFSSVDKDYPGQPGSRSQGYFQIDTPTWQQFGAKAGVDLSKYPTAMTAADGSPVPRDVQAQVASLVPFSRFGQRTQTMLGQQFGQIDPSKTVGQLSQQFGTTVNTTAPAGSPGPVDPSIIARGGTSPPLPTTPGAPAATAVASATPQPFNWATQMQPAAKGQAPTLADNLKQMFGKGQGQGQGGDQGEPRAPAYNPPQPFVHREDPSTAYMNYGTTLNSIGAQMPPRSPLTGNPMGASSGGVLSPGLPGYQPIGAQLSGISPYAMMQFGPGALGLQSGGINMAPGQGQDPYALLSAGG